MLTLHISHNDLDGLGCGVLIKKYLTGTIKTIYLGYDDIETVINEKMNMYDRIIITDISIPYGTVEMLAGEKDVIIIDHHASSENMKNFSFTIHDISKSATLLTYDWLEKQGCDVEPYKEFALCVNDIDMWQLKRSDSQKMAILFSLMGIERMEKRFLERPYNGFTETENLLINLEEERKNSYIKKAMRSLMNIKDKNGNDVCIVFAEKYASELGNHIIQDGTADYVLLINAQNKRVSIRSRQEIDIRMIAEENGGGGHKNAAGFPITNEEFDIKGILTRIGIL